MLARSACACVTSFPAFWSAVIRSWSFPAIVVSRPTAAGLVVGRDDFGGHRDHEQVDPVPGDDRPDVGAERGHVGLAVDLRLQGGEPGRVCGEERLERGPVAVGESVGVRDAVLEGRDRHEPAVDLAVAERLEVRDAVVLGRRPLDRAGPRTGARSDLRRQRGRLGRIRRRARSDDEQAADGQGGEGSSKCELHEADLHSMRSVPDLRDPLTCASGVAGVTFEPLRKSGDLARCGCCKAIGTTEPPARQGSAPVGPANRRSG